MFTHVYLWLLLLPLFKTGGQIWFFRNGVITIARVLKNDLKK